MNVQALDALTQQVDKLDADAKLELLAHLVDSLRRQVKAEYRPLVAYGVGRGEGFSSPRKWMHCWRGARPVGALTWQQGQRL